MPAASSGGRIAVVVEHERLDQIVEMALVIRDVDDAAAADAVLAQLHVFGDALDLAENRIERMLQRAVEPVPLGGAQLFEVPLDPLPRVTSGGLGIVAEIPGHVLARQDGAPDVVRTHCTEIISSVSGT